MQIAAMAKVVGVLGLLTVFIIKWNQKREEKPIRPVQVIPKSIDGEIVRIESEDRWIYGLVDRGEDKVWIATEAPDLKVGDSVSLQVRSVVKAYESKKLGLAFEEIHWCKVPPRKGGVA